nr:hypothetical protein [uncultured Prevotella sp.]
MLKANTRYNVWSCRPVGWQLFFGGGWVMLGVGCWVMGGDD